MIMINLNINNFIFSFFFISYFDTLRRCFIFQKIIYYFIINFFFNLIKFFQKIIHTLFCIFRILTFIQSSQSFFIYRINNFRRKNSITDIFFGFFIFFIIRIYIIILHLINHFLLSFYIFIHIFRFGNDSIIGIYFTIFFVEI